MNKQTRSIAFSIQFHREVVNTGIFKIKYVFTFFICMYIYIVCVSSKFFSHHLCLKAEEKSDKVKIPSNLKIIGLRF